MATPAIYRWIKTECGQAKYRELAARQGAAARLRLAWFVAIAALRDWRVAAGTGQATIKKAPHKEGLKER